MKQRLMSSRLGYLVAGVLVLALFAFGYTIGSNAFAGSQTPAPLAPASGAGLVNPPYELPDFTLTSHTGEPMRLSDLRGRPALMFFGYTHCPDVCPATLATYKRVKTMLAEREKDVAFVFISVDGARDTPDVIAEYLGRVDPDFIGLTGSQAELERIGETYGLITNRVAPEPAEHHHGSSHNEELDSDHYFVEHTSPTFLIDANGYLRMLYFFGATPDSIVTGLEQLF